MPEKEVYSEQDIVANTLAVSLCRRPLFYTVAGTAEEVYSFLRGYLRAREDFRVVEDRQQVSAALGWFYSHMKLDGKDS